jgi:hypothetical protein
MTLSIQLNFHSTALVYNMTTREPPMPIRSRISITALSLLALMFVLAGGAALRESVTIDEVAHIGAGLSYVQKLDLRYNDEHPPLAKVLAGIPLAVRGTRANYNGTIWRDSRGFFPAFMGEWVFGEFVLTHWNNPQTTLAWARFPMLLLTLALGWVIFLLARRLGGDWGWPAVPRGLCFHTGLPGIRTACAHRYRHHIFLVAYTLGTRRIVGEPERESHSALGVGPGGCVSL